MTFGRSSCWAPAVMAAFLALLPVQAKDLTYHQRVKQDLATWGNVMEMYRADFGSYPTLDSIEDAARMAEREAYWMKPATRDPAGAPYLVESDPERYRVTSADGTVVQQDERPVAPQTRQSAGSTEPPRPRAAIESTSGTLSLTKSGSDILWSWGGTGTSATGVSSTDPQFSQVRSHFIGAPTPPYGYTWTNGVNDPASLLFFDVADNTETSKGDPPPPLPPTINPSDPASNIGNLYIGATGVIRGANFSRNAAENWVCFGSGACTPGTAVYAPSPSPAPAEGFDFVVPPGATSGPIYAIVGSLVSDVANALVSAEAVSMQIRSIGFSKQNTSFWEGGRDSGSTPQNSVYRVFYNTGTKTWQRENRQATNEPSITYYCSTQTTRDGWLVCGVGSTGYTGWFTRDIDTTSGTTLGDCVNVGTGGNVRGAAVDPNPQALGGRDVAYFAHANTGTCTPSGGDGFKVKKVLMNATGCTTIDDNSWGKDPTTGDAWCWNSIWGTQAQIGMAVDPMTGDLYVGSPTTIYKVDATTEAVTVVKTGFSGIFALDVLRQGPDDPGFVLVASNTSNTVHAFALDNLTAPAIVVSTTTSFLRGACWAGSVFGGPLDPTSPANVIRAVVAHNDETALGRKAFLRADPMMRVTPGSPAAVWISAPDTSEPPPINQRNIRASDPADTSYSTALAEVRWADGKDRKVCAWVGDPGKAHRGYEPEPGPTNFPPGDIANCERPAAYGAPPPGVCDNFDPFASGGVGSFVPGTAMTECKTCGGSTACQFEYRITRQVGGDNYRIFLSPAASPTGLFQSATSVYSAWKHAHIEPDPMGRDNSAPIPPPEPAYYGLGGILKEDGLAGGSVIYLAMYPPGIRVDALAQGDTIHIFDADNTREDPQCPPVPTAPCHDVACIKTLTVDTALDRVQIELGEQGNCNTTYALRRFYDTDDAPTSPNPWLFKSGRSAGIIKDGSPLFSADPSDLQRTFDDAFVSWHVQRKVTEGSGVIPFLPQNFFDGDLPMPVDGEGAKRFSKIWFKNFVDDGAGNDPPTPKRHNYFHLMGASFAATGLGDAVTRHIHDMTYLFVGKIEQANGSTNPTPHILEDTNHEQAHQLRALPCSGPEEHDNPPQNAWCGPCGTAAPVLCILNTLTFDELQDGVSKLELQELRSGDSHCPPNGSIRFQPDPL